MEDVTKVVEIPKLLLFRWWDRVRETDTQRVVPL